MQLSLYEAPPSAVDLRTIAQPLLQCLIETADVRTLLALLQTCQALHAVVDREQVWQSVAEACWSHLAAVGRCGGYRTYKGLLLDDNRCNAALALMYQNTACVYRFQRPLAFYECRLLQLQWWRTTNSLRLYFDARGEADLRLPLDSSIAVVRLNDKAAATAACVACCSCRVPHQAAQPAAAPAPIAAAAPAASATAAAAPAAASTACTGCFDLDAFGTRLLVQAPDACHTFVQKPGHYKGVLIWHAAKTTALLRALLLQHPADSNTPPAQQHSRLAAGCRSEAWEEWAEWQLDHDAAEPAELPTASSSSGSSAGGAFDHSSGMAGQFPASFGALLRSYFLQQHSDRPASSSSSRQEQPSVKSDSMSKQQEPPRHALVFCYANELRWYHTMRTPDYSIAPLAVAQPVPSTRSPPTVPQGLCPSQHGRPFQQQGQVNKHMLRKAVDTVVLDKREEGQLAAAWRQLPGACTQQCGALDQQLQAESCAQEKMRWAGLCPAVKARGDGWWV